MVDYDAQKNSKNPSLGSFRGQTSHKGGDLMTGDSSSPHEPLPDYLKGLYEEVVEYVNPEEAKEVKELLVQYRSLFAGKQMPLGKTHLIKHHIDTGKERPIKVPVRRYGPFYREVISNEIQSMLEKGAIRPSQRAWNSPLCIVKKGDGTYRVCLDARACNDLTKKDSYPLPLISDCLDSLSGAKWFCSMDLNSGFWQVDLEESSKQKTAFSTPDGHFEFEVLCSGSAMPLPPLRDSWSWFSMASGGMSAWFFLMISLFLVATSKRPKIGSNMS